MLAWGIGLTCEERCAAHVEEGFYHQGGLRVASEGEEGVGEGGREGWREGGSVRSQRPAAAGAAFYRCEAGIARDR